MTIGPRLRELAFKSVLLVTFLALGLALSTPGCGPADSAGAPAARDAGANVIPLLPSADAAPPETALDSGPSKIDAASPSDGGVSAPRAIAPLSTSTVTSQTPTLRWELAPGSAGAHVEVCHDRACSEVEQSLDSAGTSVVVPSPLAAGVHFWRLTTAGASYSPTWEFWVGHRSASVSTSWGTTLDVNGDGYADVIAGTSGNAFGAAYLFLGGNSGPSGATLLPDPSRSAFGNLVASAGDVNGDGYGDLFVGTQAGMAYVYLGGAAGLGASAIVLAPPTGVCLPAACRDYGVSVTSGDLNGDGYADLAVGGGVDTNVFIYLGGANGPSANPMTLPSFGTPSAGDVNGDGHADLIVSPPSFSTTSAVDIYLGSLAGPGTSPTKLAIPSFDIDSGATQYFVTAATGDTNGDGYADLIIGGYGDNAAGGVGGEAFVYFGGASGLAATPTALTGPGGTFGRSLASTSDLNGDGYADVVVVGSVGAPQSAAYLYLGGASGVSTTPTALTLPVEPGTSVSYSLNLVAGGGDVNGDGFDDLLAAGGCGTAVPTTVTCVYVYFGSATGLPTLPSTVLTGPPGASTLGASVY